MKNLAVCQVNHPMVVPVIFFTHLLCYLEHNNFFLIWLKKAYSQTNKIFENDIITMPKAEPKTHELAS